MRTADVVVVGGGCVGASAAYHLAAAGAGSVLLLEREDALGTGATGACAGGFRHQFGSRINVELSLASIPMITAFEETHGLPLDVHQDGYLFLVREEDTWAAYRDAAERQRSLGVAVELMGAEDAAAVLPGIALDDVLGAVFGPEDGIADPSGLTLGYATLARREGATIETGVEALGIRLEGGTAVGVTTPDGPVAAGAVVNAAGPWAASMAATAGVDLPLEPIPRILIVTAGFTGAPERWTLVIDAETTFYFHREGQGVLMGMGGRDERPSFDTAVDERFLTDEVLPTAVRVFPPLAAASLAQTWCGLYEMTPDRHPVIGQALPGLYLANGFSGHGFQHAPIVGKLLAEMILEGEATTVDVSALGVERFARGELILETHVI